MAKFYFLGNTSNSQMMGCVIKTKNQTIVIDGGTEQDYPQLLKLLNEISSAKVDAWFFTHMHHDHIGAFVKSIENGTVFVDEIYLNIPKLEDIIKYDERNLSDFEINQLEKIYSYFSASNCLNIVQKGDKFIFDETEIEILRVYNPQIKVNFINNSSMVFKVQGAKKSVLILGDLGEEGGDETLKINDVSSLKTDYTQLAHHGQNGVRKEFYQKIQPKICLWAAPVWLWENNIGGGFDSGPFNTVRTREWMEEIGVEGHIIEKDGTTEFEI